jgi:hypothetical protein
MTETERLASIAALWHAIEGFVASWQSFKESVKTDSFFWGEDPRQRAKILKAEMGQFVWAIDRLVDDVYQFYPSGPEGEAAFEAELFRRVPTELSEWSPEQAARFKREELMRKHRQGKEAEAKWAHLRVV